MDAKVLTFRNNFSWTFFSGVFYAFSQWYIISIIAKLTDAETVGLYSLALAITAPIFLFLSMNLKSIIATDIQGETSFSKYFIFRFVTSSMALGISTLLLFILPFENYYKIVIFLVAGVKWVETLSDVCHGKFQQKENMRYVAISKCYRALFSIIVFTVVLWFTDSLILSLLFQLVSWLLVVLFYDFLKIKKDYSLSITKPSLNFFTFKKLMIYAIPLGIAMTLDSLHANLPRYFISFFNGEEALGIYAGISYIMIAGQTFIVSLSQVTIPRLAKYYITDLNAYKKLIGKMLFLAFLLGVIGLVVAILFGNTILSLLYSEEYIGYKNILILIMVTSIFWYMSGFLNAALIATRRFKIQIPIYLSSTLITLVLSILLIPLYALSGAVLALLSGHLLRFIFSLFMVNKAIKNNQYIH
ncbi:oligosaccharide flippase family protein [Salinicoccus halitifaciens]|uniref:O-antigen/teichoic acid export membrane protein n=1 Tax=Salinicoccus halitifaciens TaxID=1073415 RepID=A0ABV2EDC9_9STAP|nr:oligosaccharide flippase family protein [Salinicoccus halitifaciens]MCD2138784.1 oligosaccharide flippase family protein [Salinicoccus halitifaciens]